LEQATAWVNYLERSHYDFDVGLGQVNIRNIHKYGYKAVDMLDPCKNLRVASSILLRNYQNALTMVAGNQKDALYKAISAYNTGNYQHGFKNGYVQKVVNNAWGVSTPKLKVSNGLANTEILKNSKPGLTPAMSPSLVYAKPEINNYAAN